MEKSTDLEHALRRADQYETEVRKLRGRIDDLKHDLTKAEDEMDQSANQSRRLQRTNDELQTHVDNLKVQVDHLHTRYGPRAISFFKAKPYIFHRKLGQFLQFRIVKVVRHIRREFRLAAND